MQPLPSGGTIHRPGLGSSFGEKVRNVGDLHRVKIRTSDTPQLSGQKSDGGLSGQITETG
jgi:hypothetical protein